MDNDCDRENTACLVDVESAQKLPQELVESRLDHKIFLFFGVRALGRGTNATIVTASKFLIF